MEHKTVQVIFIFIFFIAACASVPHSQQFRKSLPTNDHDDDAQIILGEGIVSSAQLNLQQPNSKTEDDGLQAAASKKALLTAFKEPLDEIGKSENDPVDFGNDEYIAALSSDQYAHAAIASPELLNVNNKRATVRVPSNSPLTVASANPIYITIPIYLNKGDGQPLRLSVGGQEIPLNPKLNVNGLGGEPLSPTSQYNRLLKPSSLSSSSSSSSASSSSSSKHNKKSSRKSSGKKKRHHTTVRKASSSRKNTSSDSHRHHADKQFHSYRFYF